MAAPGPGARAAFAAYVALAAATWIVPRRPWGKSVALAADVIALSGALWLGMNPWLTFLPAAFLATEILVFHEWPELLLAGGPILLLVWFLQPPLMPGYLALLLAMGAGVLVRRSLQERLFQVSRQAVLYRAESQSARTLERDRLADDFHDGPLQAFTGLLVRLGVVRRLIEKDKPREAISELDLLRQLWQEQTLEVRAFVQEVRHGQSGPADLSDAIRRAVQQFERHSDIVVRLKTPDTLPELPAGSAVALLQMIREALHNVHKHARASLVSIQVAAVAGGVEVSVEDNGGGFPFGGTYTLKDLELLDVGPLSIRRRVRDMRGELALESRPGQGSTLRIRIPS
jgi:signal transduction histidine kinase